MILYGHRGAKGEAPENTMPGFRYALSVGVQAFEFDVRLSADQELVILHDATVDRTTNGKGAVADLTCAQLFRFDARADFDAWSEPCCIPTLADVLAVLPDDAHFEAEIKRDEPARLEILVPKLIEAIAARSAGGYVTITSFDANALRIARRLAPEIPRGFIGAYDTPEYLATALELGCTAACIPLGTGSRDEVNKAHAHGLRVTGWPGDTIEQLERLADWQVDRITTNFPSLALPFLRQRDLME